MKPKIKISALGIARQSNRPAEQAGDIAHVTKQARICIQRCLVAADSSSSDKKKDCGADVEDPTLLCMISILFSAHSSGSVSTLGSLENSAGKARRVISPEISWPMRISCLF